MTSQMGAVRGGPIYFTRQLQPFRFKIMSNQFLLKISFLCFRKKVTFVLNGKACMMVNVVVQIFFKGTDLQLLLP